VPTTLIHLAYLPDTSPRPNTTSHEPTAQGTVSLRLYEAGLKRLVSMQKNKSLHGVRQEKSADLFVQVVYEAVR
jgi:hypothetical protein